MLSILYITPNDETRERFGFKNEQEARRTAYDYVNDGYRNVVLRYTTTEGNITITHWTESLDEDNNPDWLKAEIAERDEQIHSLKQEAEYLEGARYQIRELLRDVERSIIRGQRLNTAWFEVQVVELAGIMNA